MQLILVLLAFITLILAVLSLFMPKRLIFWCNPQDRSRAMGVTVYAVATVVLLITYVFIAPAPTPPQPQQPLAEEPAPVPAAPRPGLDREQFLSELKNRLSKSKDFFSTDMRFELLQFAQQGATAQLTFTKKPLRKTAVEKATLVVKTMVDIYKAHDVKLTPKALLECQVHTDEIIYDGEKGHRSMGFARYHPDTGDIPWLDFNG